MSRRAPAIFVLVASTTACSLLTSLDGLTPDRAACTGDCTDGSDVGSDVRAEGAPGTDSLLDVAAGADAADGAPSDAGSDADGAVVDTSDADAAPPIAVVQSAFLTTNGIIVAPVQQGSLIVVAAVNNASSVMAVWDNAPGGSNTYALLGDFSVQPPGDAGDSGGIASMWYAKNVRPGATKIDLTWGAGMAVAWAVEVSGVTSRSAPVHQSLNTQPAAPLVVAPRVAPAAARSFVFSLGVSAGSVTNVASGNSFTPLDFQWGDDAAYFVSAASGSYGASWTSSSDAWGAMTAAF